MGWNTDFTDDTYAHGLRVSVEIRAIRVLFALCGFSIIWLDPSTDIYADFRLGYDKDCYDFVFSKLPVSFVVLMEANVALYVITAEMVKAVFYRIVKF